MPHLRILDGAAEKVNIVIHFGNIYNPGHSFEYITFDRKTNHGRVSMFFDMADCGYNNLDLSVTRVLIGVMKSYYPNVINYLITFEMPWIFNGGWPIMLL